MFGDAWKGAQLRCWNHGGFLVQLGGLEPPTSCSTDRRSNQLSYNCILESRVPQKERRRTGRKLGATPRFGKAAKASNAAAHGPIHGPILGPIFGVDPNENPDRAVRVLVQAKTNPRIPLSIVPGT
jgi:hypothetical protein